MALALRAIRLERWDEEELLGAAWLPEQDIVADVLSDLHTRGGRLSVWHIEPDRSNLERVLVAFATGRDVLANVDYILFDESLLTTVGVQLEQENGESADETANREWHYNLTGVSGHRLAALARRMLERGEKGGLLKQELELRLARACRANEVDIAKLNRKMKQAVQGMLSSH